MDSITKRQTQTAVYVTRKQEGRGLMQLGDHAVEIIKLVECVDS